MFNFEDIGNPIAKIISKKKYNNISLSEDGEGENPFSNLKVKSNEKLQHIPNSNRERDVLYITGQSGSGKSYYAKNYIKEYHKLHPKNNIYLFSNLRDDETLQDVKYLKKIDIFDEDFLDTEIDINEFENSIVLFDDVDCIRDKKIKSKIFGLLDELLMTGRHTNTTIIFTSHIACNGIETKPILNEAHTITIYPSTMGARNLKYILEGYFGLDKKQIERIKKMNSRWITIVRSYPQVLISENEILLTKDL